MLDRLERGYQTSSALSAAYARIYRRTLALLAAASTVLTLAFLLYDEAEAVWMIFVCGAMLLLAWQCQRYASRSACHRRYIEYRAMAESCRVQAYLRCAGSSLQVVDLFTWTQQEETAWITNARSALSIGPAPREGRDIRDCWVEGQRRYHADAAVRVARKSRGSGRVVSAALAVSVLLYLAAVLFEIFAGGRLFPPVLALGAPETYRTVLKIVLGTISAATLFIANYYGRLSLSRKLSTESRSDPGAAGTAGGQKSPVRPGKTKRTGTPFLPGKTTPLFTLNDMTR